MTTTPRLSEREATAPAAAVLAALLGVIDPELGIDVVNLGLVHAVELEGSTARVRMTLTTPGCPLHASIEAQARAAVEAVPGVERAVVDLVWDPPWTPFAMTDEAKRRLGFL